MNLGQQGAPGALNSQQAESAQGHCRMECHGLKDTCLKESRPVLLCNAIEATCPSQRGLSCNFCCWPGKAL